MITHQFTCFTPSLISLTGLNLSLLWKTVMISKVRRFGENLPPVPIFPQMTLAMVDPLFQVMSVLPICETQT